MARPQLYSNKEILDRMRVHLIDNFGSVYSMHSPTWVGIKKRMAKDEELNELVSNIVAEALYAWEKMGIAALLSGDDTFNVALFKHYTMNKASFIDHKALELEERIEQLEESNK